MPQPRSYPQPTPTITVDYSASNLSRWGFFPVILEYLRKRQLPQQLGAITIQTAANGLYSTRDKLMRLVTIFILGIARISHVDRSLAGETALARTLGLKRFPSSDTLYTLLKKVTTWHVKQVDRLHQSYLTEQARLEETMVIADLDLSVKSTEGRKRQGATPGHNPQHKGRDCYQWAVAFVSGLVIWQQLYRGNTSGQGLVGSALDALNQRLPRLDLLRLDGGFLSAKVLNLLVDRQVGYLVKAGCKLKSIRTLVERTRPEEWQRVRPRNYVNANGPLG